MGFPGGASDKEPACQCRRHKGGRFNSWVRKIPWRRECNPLQYPCLENPMDRRAMYGYSPYGHKESDTTEAV